MMKILTFSTLFPNQEKPGHGIFVETRLRHLIASGQVEARVVAPVPWFPWTHPRFGDYARFARVERHEQRLGLQVMHPRYPVLPKVGMQVAPWLLAQAVRPVIQRIISDGYDFDVIDAHYFYPDGVAAAMLARQFGKPLVITARGSDITLIPGYRGPRRAIIKAALDADAVITVCEALKDELVRLGIAASHITTLRNGVDLKLFQPQDRVQVRRALGIDGFTLLSVGNLVALKGHDLVIQSLLHLPQVRLLIAGKGPLQSALESMVRQAGLADRVRFLGALPQNELARYYAAADALVLASSREGWANVLLEAMACGTPVVATRVWGTPEVVAAPEAGVLIDQRSAEAISAAVMQLRQQGIDRAATRRYAERFSWEDTTSGQIRLFRQIVHQRAPGLPPAAVTQHASSAQ